MRFCGLRQSPHIIRKNFTCDYNHMVSYLLFLRKEKCGKFFFLEKIDKTKGAPKWEKRLRRKYSPLCRNTLKKGGIFMEKAPCRSIFKNGTDRTTQAEVTRIWAVLINQAEKASTILARENA